MANTQIKDFITKNITEKSGKLSLVLTVPNLKMFDVYEFDLKENIDILSLITNNFTHLSVDSTTNAVNIMPTTTIGGGKKNKRNNKTKKLKYHE